MASSNGTVQASLPEWMSPTWTTSWMLVSALIVWMNAGVASNSAFLGKAGFVVSQYGEPPYPASAAFSGLPPADAAPPPPTTTPPAPPTAMNFLINPPPRSMVPSRHGDATKRAPADGLPAR